MAKRARARRSSMPSPRRYTYTPELLASGRHRFEHTTDSIPDIAVDFGIHKTTLLRLAKREGWVRYVASPRDLPAAVKLARQAEALAGGQGALTPPARGRSPAEAERRRAGGVRAMRR